MSEQTVVIGSVEFVRSGEKNGKAWSIYDVKDGNGTKLGSCFKELSDSAQSLIGQRAIVVNEIRKNEKDGKTYENLVLTSVLPAPPEKNGDGEVDWDAKELRGHIRACYAIASSARPGAEWPEVQAFAEKILARVYDPSAPDKPASPFIPPSTAPVGAPVGHDDDIPFAMSWA